MSIIERIPQMLADAAYAEQPTTLMYADLKRQAISHCSQHIRDLVAEVQRLAAERDKFIEWHIIPRQQYTFGGEILDSQYRYTAAVGKPTRHDTLELHIFGTHEAAVAAVRAAAGLDPDPLEPTP